MNIKQFDELVELWDEEGQPPEIDWLEHAQDFRNQTQQLEAENQELQELFVYFFGENYEELAGGDDETE